jgi:hypothetical protein
MNFEGSDTTAMILPRQIAKWPHKSATLPWPLENNVRTSESLHLGGSPQYVVYSEILVDPGSIETLRERLSAPLYGWRTAATQVGV